MKRRSDPHLGATISEVKRFLTSGKDIGPETEKAFLECMSEALFHHLRKTGQLRKLDDTAQKAEQVMAQTRGLKS